MFTCSILILPRNRHDALTKLVDSISALKVTNRSRINIVILDNASTETVNAKAFTRRIHYALRVIRTNQNVGLTKGRNLLAQEATGEWLFFIDDDAYIQDDLFFRYFDEYISAIDTTRLAAVACNIREYGNPNKSYLPFSRRTRRVLNLSMPIKCGYFLGGAHFIRRDVFLEQRGYDERLFFWGEELDLSYRLVNTGYEIHYVPHLRVVHKKSATKHLTKSQERTYFLRNRIYLNHRYFPWHIRLLSDLIWLTVFIIRTHDIRTIFRSVKESINLLQGTERQILSRLAMHYLRENHGRIYY